MNDPASEEVRNAAAAVTQRLDRIEDLLRQLLRRSDEIKTETVAITTCLVQIAGHEFKG